MARARAKSTPMSYEEMVDQGIASKSSNRMFSIKSADENDQRLTALVNASIEEFEKAADAINTMSLTDTDTVQKRTMMYVRACADAGTLPTYSGLLRSFGMSRNAGYQFQSRNPRHSTTKWLEMYQDYCADLLADAALRGLTYPVFSIFVEKSRNMWDDKVVIETRQNRSAWDDDERSPEEIAEKYKYLLDAETDDDYMLPD